MSDQKTLGLKIEADATGANAGLEKLEKNVVKVDEATKKLQRTNAALAREATSIFKGLQTPIEAAQQKVIKLTEAFKAGQISVEDYRKYVRRLRDEINGIKAPNLGGGGGGGGGDDSRRGLIQALNPIAGGNGAIIGNIGGKMGGAAMGAALGAVAIEATGRIMSRLGEAGEKFAEAMKTSDGSTASLAANMAKSLPIVGTFVNGGERLAMGFSDATSAVLKWAGYSKETYEWWKSSATVQKEMEERSAKMAKQMEALAKLREMDKDSEGRIKKLNQETQIMNTQSDYQKERLRIQFRYQDGLEEINKREQEAKELARQGKAVDASVFDTLQQERAALTVKSRSEIRAIDEKERDDAAKHAEEIRKKNYDAAKKIWDDQQREAKKLADEAQRRRDGEIKAAQSLIASTWTPAEKASMELAKAQQMMERGDIGQGTYDRLKKNLGDGLAKDIPKTVAPALVGRGSVEEYRLKVADQNKKRDTEILNEQKKLMEDQVSIARQHLEAFQAAASNGGGTTVGFN